MSAVGTPTELTVTQFSSHAAPRPPVALVYMPWGAVPRGAISVSLLKALLKRHDYPCDVHYLNVRFAKEIGLDLYSRITEASAFFPEWFFSTALFGPKGLGVLDNRWDSLSGVWGDRLKSELAKMVGEPAQQMCEKIAEDVVPRFVQECLDSVEWSRYAVVGFSLTFAQTIAALLLAYRIRQRHPQVKIVFGGASVDSEMGFEMLKAFDWIDYVVHGEAERTFPQLLDNITAGRAFEPIPGISMREKTRLIRGNVNGLPLQDLNESPAPDYSDYFLALQAAGLDRTVRVSLPFEASRGCWWGAKHHCTFCGLNGTTMAFRKKSPARVYEEIIHLSSEYRCLALDAVDNILAMDYFTELLPRLAEANFDLRLFFEVKANMTRRHVELLRAAGITHIQPGIESVSTRLLKLMNKGVTAMQNVQLLKWCYEFGIFPSWNVLHGFPGETPADYAEAPRILRSISHLCPPVGINAVIFERFSPYHFDREKYSLALEASPFYHLLFPGSVDMEKIAYYFGRKGETDPPTPCDSLVQCNEFLTEWQEAWKGKKWFCYFERGPGFITIYDSRPLVPGTSSAGRKTTLRALAAQIYLFCDEHRSFKAIQEMLGKDGAEQIQPEKIQELLNHLVSSQLMFEEEGRYLALAVHKKAQHLTN